MPPQEKLHLAQCVLNAAGGAKCSSQDALVDLGETISAAWQEAQGKWPKTTLQPAVFASCVGEHCTTGEDYAKSVRDCGTSELYLARACLNGDPVALRLFESEYLATLQKELAKSHFRPDIIQEAVQNLRTRLFVNGPTGAKLQSYSGRGSLKGWLRVAALREGLRLSKRTRRETALDDALIDAFPDVGADIDRQYQRELYGAEFRKAFADAITALSHRERSLLRQSIVHGSSIDQIAQVYRVHRATAARWLKHARERLANETRRRLMRELGLDESELDSVMRTIQSQLDVSVARLLGPDTQDPKV